MSSTLYYEIKLTSVNEDRPSDFGVKLQIGDLIVRNKYIAEYAGDAPDGSIYIDYPEFQIVGISYSKPLDYSNDMVEYEIGTETASYFKYGSIIVPDNFILPDYIPKIILTEPATELDLGWNEDSDGSFASSSDYLVSNGFLTRLDTAIKDTIKGVVYNGVSTAIDVVTNHVADKLGITDLYGSIQNAYELRSALGNLINGVGDLLNLDFDALSQAELESKIDNLFRTTQESLLQTLEERLDSSFPINASAIFSNIRIVNTIMYDNPNGPVTNYSVEHTEGNAKYLGGAGRDIVLDGASSSLIYGNAGQDILVGGEGNDILFGGLNNDLLIGGEGDDVITGGKGNDFLNAGSGNDKLDGGNGNDRLTYYNAAAGVTVNLNFTSAQNTIGSGFDTIINIESLIGSQYNDILIGNNNSNALRGGAGNDLLKGGNGIDTVSYAFAITGVKVNLNISIAQNTRGDGWDTLKSIENIGGSDFNDILIGNSRDNVLNGLDGVDRLNGGAGNDTLILTEFSDDSINGGTGTDTLKITSENQTLDLSNAIIKNIETISFSKDGFNTLKVTAQSIIDLSTDGDVLKVDAVGENTLMMDSGWIDEGVIDGYQSFSKEGATLLVNPEIANIVMEALPTTYTISDQTTSENVSGVFDSGVQEITIDFGGKRYVNTGIKSIDLTGFGLEDKLFFARHDGELHNGNVRSVNVDYYKAIYEEASTRFNFYSDYMIWPNLGTVRLGSLHGTQITVIGLPIYIPPNQLVFV